MFPGKRDSAAPPTYHPPWEPFTMDDPDSVGNENSLDRTAVDSIISEPGLSRLAKEP